MAARRQPRGRVSLAEGLARPTAPQRSKRYAVWRRAECPCAIFVHDLGARMTPKAKTVYRCTECGADHPKWAGRCDVCGEWNSLVEEMAARPVANGGASRRAGGARTLAEGGSVAATPRLRDVSGSEAKRWKTGIDEFDFVLGGGIVPGSMILIGGEPGIGKSTLLLQVAARLQSAGHATLYASGEESALQIKLRADRLSEDAGDVSLLSETNLETVLTTAAAVAPAVLIVDSIQTVFTTDLEGAPGNVGQVRECAARLMRFAKESGTAVFVVGHVTKGGGIAGPKTLEHIVDTVLYFEGENSLEHRVLRATKNRFGSVDEIGVFRMTEEGLIAVENPSELFLGDRSMHASGSAVTALLEGSRTHPDRDPGARREGGLRHAAARRHGLRRTAPRTSARGARQARRTIFLAARCLPQRRRRSTHAGAGRRSRRRRRARVQRV